MPGEPQVSSPEATDEGPREAWAGRGQVREWQDPRQPARRTRGRRHGCCRALEVSGASRIVDGGGLPLEARDKEQTLDGFGQKAGEEAWALSADGTRGWQHRVEGGKSRQDQKMQQRRHPQHCQRHRPGRSQEQEPVKRRSRRPSFQCWE